MNGTVDVDNTVCLLVPENYKRKKLTVFNTDAAITVWIGQGGAGIGRGVPLYPQTGFTDTRDPLGYIYQGGYSAIGDAAGPATISYIEEE